MAAPIDISLELYNLHLELYSIENALQDTVL